MKIEIQLSSPCYADPKRELQPGDYTAQVTVNGVPFGHALHAKKVFTEEQTMRAVLEELVRYFVREVLKERDEE